MERIIKLKKGAPTLFMAVLLMFLCSCDDLLGNPDWPDIYGSTWESHNGNVQFNVGERSSSVTITGAAGYFSVRYYDKYYSGYFPISVLFGGASDPLSYVLRGDYSDDPDGGSGKIILIKKNNKSITVEFTGAITIPEVQLYKKDLVDEW